MKNVRLITSNGLIENLSNLYYKDDSNVFEIKDAVEDSNNGIELMNNINSLNLLRKFNIDKETDDYVRLVSVDTLGNKSYLKAYK